MTGKITLRARLSTGDEPPGFDIEVEVVAAGMPDAAKAEIARRLADQAMFVLGKIPPPILQLPDFADGDPVPVPMPMMTRPGQSSLPRDARL